MNKIEAKLRDMIEAQRAELAATKALVAASLNTISVQAEVLALLAAEEPSVECRPSRRPSLNLPDAYLARLLVAWREAHDGWWSVADALEWARTQGAREDEITNRASGGELDLTVALELGFGRLDAPGVATILHATLKKLAMSGRSGGGLRFEYAARPKRAGWFKVSLTPEELARIESEANGEQRVDRINGAHGVEGR